MTLSIHRFVPATNAVSLSSDAPGYVHNANANPDGGPTCYKCKGFGNMFYRNCQKLCDPRLLLVGRLWFVKRRDFFHVRNAKLTMPVYLDKSHVEENAQTDGLTVDRYQQP